MPVCLSSCGFTQSVDAGAAPGLACGEGKGDGGEVHQSSSSSGSHHLQAEAPTGCLQAPTPAHTVSLHPGLDCRFTETAGFCCGLHNTSAQLSVVHSIVSQLDKQSQKRCSDLRLGVDDVMRVLPAVAKCQGKA